MFSASKFSQQSYSSSERRRSMALTGRVSSIIDVTFPSISLSVHSYTTIASCPWDVSSKVTVKLFSASFPHPLIHLEMRTIYPSLLPTPHPTANLVREILIRDGHLVSPRQRKSAQKPRQRSPPAHFFERIKEQLWKLTLDM